MSVLCDVCGVKAPWQVSECGLKLCDLCSEKHAEEHPECNQYELEIGGMV